MDETKYKNIVKPAISILDVCKWMLGTCSTVHEAINLLTKINIYGASIPALNRIIGLHIVIHDAYGLSIVCEISDSSNNIYQTKGIVTNGPNYPEQYRENKLIISDSLSSINRFIKLSELKHLCVPESLDNIGLVHLICHMFNTVDIVRGTVLSKRPYGYIYHITQWCLIKDLTHKIIYYRSYNDMTLHRLDLKTIDFSNDNIYTEISIDSTTPTILDINF